LSTFRTDEGIDQVRLALEAYVETWNSGRVSGLRRFWDLQHPEPVYVAEEQEALSGWPAIEAYWAALDGLKVRVTTGVLQLSRLTPEVILAHYPMHWRIDFDEHPHWTRPIGGHVRVSVIFVQRAEGWKILHYIEAPFAPAVQVRKWLERDADAR
jgi:hypothetical protein